MKQAIISAFILISLLTPALSAAQNNGQTANTERNIISQLFVLIKKLEARVSALADLFAPQDKRAAEKDTASIINSLFKSEDKDCDNYHKICPISPFGTHKEPPPEPATSTVPEIVLNRVDISANTAIVDYSVSDIQDNQTTLWLDYGTSSSALNSTTAPATLSYGITGRHGLDNANFLISALPESVCLYASSTSPNFPEFAAFPIYNPDPPVYYFRFETENNLGTSFTPLLDQPPFSFQFDNFRGEKEYENEDGALVEE